MNSQQKYEQTIAGKLQSLPVPDMADAIWSRIEAQLDIDLPTDDGGGANPPSTPPSGPGMIGWGLSVVVIALISIFLLSKNKTETNNNQTSVPPNETIQQPIETRGDPPPANTTIQQPVNSISDPLIDNTTNAQPDSAVQQSITGVGGGLQDSAFSDKAPPLVSTVPPVIKDSIPPTGKKRRGVSGLNDNDYRIEPKKDN